ATFTQWNSGSIGLHLVLQTYPSQLCLIWFVYLGSRVCRQLPSDSTSRWTPLSLANGSYYQVRRRLSLPRHNTCPAHNRNSLLCFHSKEWVLHFIIAQDNKGVALSQESYHTF